MRGGPGWNRDPREWILPRRATGRRGRHERRSMASAPISRTLQSGADVPERHEAAFAQARKAMIDSQLRPSGITHPGVLAAMAATRREDYVAGDQRTIAYMDRQLPLGQGRAMSPPFAQALLLQNAAPRQSDKALLVAGGTGYLAALLAPMVASLDVVESDARLGSPDGTRAGDWHSTDLTDGWKKGGLFDLIVIDGAIETLPKPLMTQLAPGGRLVTGLVDRGVTRIAIGRKTGPAPADPVALQPLAETAVPILADFATPKGWQF